MVSGIANLDIFAFANPNLEIILTGTPLYVLGMCTSFENSALPTETSYIGSPPM